MLSILIAALAGSQVVQAAPLMVRRDVVPAGAPWMNSTDAKTILVFTFADVLEQLESQFYTQALAKFQPSDFTAAGFSNPQVPIQLITSIANDEKTHSSVLQSALQSAGAKSLTSCSFDFSKSLTDLKTTAATARLVENVGVGAYLGAATLLSDAAVLNAASSILTVEARHQSLLNVLNGATAIPSSFDIPLTPSEVLAIAGPFISGCDVGIKANPTLTITNTGAVAPGTTLTFSSPAINSSASGLFCQMITGGAAISQAFPLERCVVPAGINGPVAIWITSDGQPLINNVRDRATSQLVAGPTMTFIDTVSEPLASLVLNGSGTIVPAVGVAAAGAGNGTGVAANGTVTAPTPQVSVVPAASPVAFFTGPGISPDGKLNVLGLSTIPRSAVVLPTTTA